jgi:hypothetical protein
MDQKTKIVWKMKVDVDGCYFLENENGDFQYKNSSKLKLSDCAFHDGADEIIHDYNLTKY